MGRYLTPGHEYEDGQTISGPSLTEHVSESVLKPSAISEQVLKTPAALTDELLINDAATLKKITLQQVKALVLLGLTTIPVGAVADFAGTDAPEGWLLCYGQEVSRDTFSALFGVIGVAYGAGNGTSSFNVPDLRGRVGAGVDNMGGTNAARIGDPALNVGLVGTTLGSVGGRYYHQLTTAELASHAHTFNDYYQTTTTPGGGGTLQFGNDNHVQETGVTTPNGTAAAGSNSAHNNVQPTMMLNKIIKT